MSKYIIVNAEAIQKRIEELKEGLMLSEKGTVAEGILLGGIIQLEETLSQSTPLIPEIEKAFNAAKIPYKVNDYGTFGYENAEHYIENLKLDYDTTRDS